MVRTDERLIDGAPMQPVRCLRCSATVQARKASWQQTSLQWNAEAAGACEERPAERGERFEACGALRDSVRAAAVEGSLEVPEA
ncbi:ferredoxin [Nocardiopsis sp. HNM0947]|uniref:Ferredoxin n=1 Tax=Nocardiopsis coralli TaxID=2772213 RepID=A0ABR9NZT0_9ACTN|nr:ferredoxin [Nocardiopsis coralli]MBE2997096.1 ferredoxin [Nocardiopsis coralli]